MKPPFSLLQLFSKNFCYDFNRPRLIGMEGEFPVVDRDGHAVDYAVIKALFDYLQQQGFDLEYDSSTGVVVSAKRLSQYATAQATYPYDVISTDTGYSIIEISPAPVENLFILQQVFEQLMQLLLVYVATHDVLILGYGIQPLTPPSRLLMADKSRYLFFRQWSGNEFISQQQGHDCDFLTISASSQTHVDVHVDEAIDAVNVMNGLAGLQIILHANSPLWQGRIDPQAKAMRELQWQRCFINRDEQVGIPNQFTTISDYVGYLCGFKPQTVERDGQVLCIESPQSFMQFLMAQSVLGKTFDGRDQMITPQLSDIYDQAGYAWFNGRLAPKHGTVEARVYCQQPPTETLCSHALTLGLIENLSAAVALLQRFPWQAWRQLRQDALRDGFNAQLAGHSVIPILVEFLHIAQAGLQQRGLNEDIFIMPLFERLNKRQSPADQVIDLFNQQGLTAILDAFSFKRVAVEDYALC